MPILFAAMVQTTYLKIYVETFEERIIIYFKHCIMNNFPSMSVGTVKSIAENYSVFQITRVKEPKAKDIHAEYRIAIVDFTNTNPDVINLQRLVPCTPLTKVEASKHPGKLIPLFRYILGSFEHMGDKYRREHFKKAVFVGRKILKLVSAFQTKVQVIIPTVDVLSNTIQEIIDDLDHGDGADVTTETKLSSGLILNNITGVQIMLSTATAFYDSAKSLCTFIKPVLLIGSKQQSIDHSS
jgi:hypothetical protein